MHLTNTLYVCATLIAATVAQTPTTTSLHFTTIPTALVAGVEQPIGWAGGNGNGVNIILQQGTADNLQDVPIAPIASGDEGTFISWTPPKSLPDAGNYALRIEQGEDTVNYSGMLQLFGGCSTCPTDAVAALASSTGSATASSPSSTASSASKSGTPVVTPASKSSGNSTGSSGNSTTTGSSMNSTMGTGSMANMTMPGNSTMNSTMTSATLHATSSKSSSKPKSTSSSSAASSSSSTSSSTGSSTGSSTSPSATTKSGGVAVAASNFALVLCAVVGVVYLG